MYFVKGIISIYLSSYYIHEEEFIIKAKGRNGIYYRSYTRDVMAFNVRSMYQTSNTSSSPRCSCLSFSIELHVNVYLISVEGNIQVGRVIGLISFPEQT